MIFVFQCFLSACSSPTRPYPIPEPFCSLSIVRGDQGAVDFAAGPGGLDIDESVHAHHHDHAGFLEGQMGVPRRTAQLAIHLEKDFCRHGFQNLVLG